MISICIPHTPDRRDRLQDTIDSIRENVSVPHTIVTYENNYIGWAQAVDDMLSCVRGTAFVIGSDVLIEKGCVETLAKAYAASDTAAVVEPYNELQNGKLCQHPFGDSQLIRRYLHTGYKHCFADNELTERLVKDNKYLYVPEARIDHRHFVNGKAPMDKGYEFSLGEKDYTTDRELFTKRKAAGFPQETV